MSSPDGNFHAARADPFSQIFMPDAGKYHAVILPFKARFLVYRRQLRQYRAQGVCGVLFVKFRPRVLLSLPFTATRSHLGLPTAHCFPFMNKTKQGELAFKKVEKVVS